jgi:hypothetical protein
VSAALGSIAPGVAGAAQAFLVSTGALLMLFIGFCLLFNLPKLRASGRHSRVVRGLDEIVGVPQTYLSPDAPHGRVDQLHTPELRDAQPRKFA